MTLFLIRKNDYFRAMAWRRDSPGTTLLVLCGIKRSWHRTPVLPTKYVWKSATTRLYVSAVLPFLADQTGVLPVTVCSSVWGSRSRALTQPVPGLQKRCPPVHT